MTATQLKAPLIEETRSDDVIAEDIDSAASEAKGLLATINASGYVIESVREKEFIETTMQQLVAKRKFLDDERKVSTKPLNDEVDRINDWYRPALTALQNCVDRAKVVLSAYILQQKAEAARLAAEAEMKAKAALAAKSTEATEAKTEAKTLMVQSAATQRSVQSQKGAAVTHKPVWKFRITDAASLPRAFLMPDEAKIRTHVEKNGNNDVPAGVEVFEDVSFRISKK